MARKPLALRYFGIDDWSTTKMLRHDPTRRERSDPSF